MSSKSNQSKEEYYLTVLQAYALDIIEATTFEEIAELVISALEATIDPFFYVVGQVKDGAVKGIVRHKGGLLTGPLDGDGIPIDGPGVMIRSLNTRKVINLPDTRKDPNVLSVEVTSDSYTLSEIAVPILTQGKSIGIINIEEVETHAFDEYDQKFLEDLSRYAGVSLSNIIYSNRLNGLHKHTSQLNTSSSIEEIAEQTLQAMTETLEMETCTFLLNYEGDFRPIAEKGLDKSIQLREKALQGLGNIQERFRKAEEIEFISELDTPININDKVVAILSAKSIRPDNYTDHDKQLLDILANHVASAIHRIRLQRERERVLEELTLERVRVEQANELDRMKNQFISTATHELRTPVTSIIGFLELVLDDSSEELPESVRNDLNVVFRNSMRLVDMTNDLLDVQRITSGRFEVTLEEVELINTVNDVLEELKPLFSDKKQKLLVDAPERLMVNVDESRISQLLINLLRNANKFTPEKGLIEVKVEAIDSYVQVSVKDSGIGLREEDLGKLFTPFPGIQHGLNVSSTGLGLSIAKGIVELHNGTIWAESDGLGTGSIFIFKIPS
jgi:signal transduction histidine kinase